MKPLNLFRIETMRRKKRLLSIFSLASLVFSLLVFSQIGQAQQAQFSLADVLIGLRSKKVTLDERNKLLAEAVKSRGITFSLTSEIETELAAGGASGELVEAIRGKSAKVVAPVPSSSAAPDYAYYRKRADENHLKGDFDLALVDYNKAIELNPTDAASYLNRGRVHSNKKSFDLAIFDFDKTIEMNPKDAAAYFNRADVLEKKGRTEQAIGDYQKAVELDANNQTAKANLKRLQDEQAKVLTAKQKEEEQAKILAKQKEEEQAKILAAKQKVVEAAVAAQPKPTDAPPKNAELGSLVNRAVRMITPAYPQAAKQMNISGQVKVEVMLDEQGNVVAAKAVSGPQFLRSSSEEAARSSKFKPAVASGEPVRANGFIVYNFTNKM